MVDVDRRSSVGLVPACTPPLRPWSVDPVLYRLAWRSAHHVPLAPPRLGCSRRSAGIVLGVALDRGGQFLSAQATGRAVERPPPYRPGRRRQARGAPRKRLYQQLARQYEQFQHVNRTFELVAQAVSPAVVHIVAARRPEGTRTVPAIRHYEETGSGVIVAGRSRAGTSTS